MHTLTVRDLRYDLAKVEAWLADGQEIEITKSCPSMRIRSFLPQPRVWRHR